MFEERGATFTWIGGFIALAVIATGLAMFMEKRSAASKVKADAEKVVAEDSQVLESLQDDLSRANEQWAALSGRSAIYEKYQAAKAVRDERKKQLDDVSSRHGAIKASVDQLEGSFTAYRNNYVSSMRQAAVDEELDSLTLTNGKEYSKVVIKQVTPEGLEIRHEFGSARVAAGDLDDKWNERFHWH